MKTAQFYSLHFQNPNKIERSFSRTEECYIYFQDTVWETKSNAKYSPSFKCRHWQKISKFKLGPKHIKWSSFTHT